MVEIVDLFEGRSDCDVLLSICVTAPTSHLERSPLNTVAPLNAVEVNTVVDVKQKRNHIKRSEEKKKKKNVLEGDTIE